MKRFTAFGLFGTMAILLGSIGLAMSHERNEESTARDVETEVSMQEAIETATARFPGKIIEAELEAEEGTAVYEVEIVNSDGEFREFKVDALSEQILESEREGQEDQEKSHHEDSRNHEEKP